ncbi:SDR family oxidoreductase [Lacticaseibacillus brantae]|uniref:NAD(P)-binding domain-containing protein n=1 Tax=Lacticaseibacillus brantae DSM 23927 TaxID=1423727 RepID=A0A0R2BAT6_9LACO|nr:NAD(P)H-binding protein [Lacticaseibacillus brantae]KRM72876.1 hypothetical protein FC34_GL000588 [Lacticaseibacillus brantae DSM 23927]
MKIVLTGGLGHIGPHLMRQLAQDHDVVMITTNPNHRQQIQALGVTPLLGNLTDPEFLNRALVGADAVFLMLAGHSPDEVALNPVAFGHSQGKIFAQAINANRVARVVYLSSLGAELNDDQSGFYVHRLIEAALNQTHAAVTFVRPGYFYNDFFEFAPKLRAQQLAANFSDQEQILFAAPEDVAPVIGHNLIAPTGEQTVYGVSDVVTGAQIVAGLKQVLSMPQLNWQMLTDAAFRQWLIQNGATPDFARQQVAMWAYHRAGRINQSFWASHSALLPTKFSHFAGNFAKRFEQKLI